MVLGLVGAALFVGAAAWALLTYPQPLFAYHISHGRLALYSDKPFDPARGRAVLTEIEQRLARSPLNDDKRYRIFVANTGWRNRLVFLWNHGAGGVNYYPLPNVFIRKSDIDVDRVMNSFSLPVPSPRTLAYFGAHEIGHSLVAKEIGAIPHLRLPVWVREGLADYIAFGGEVPIGALARDLRQGAPDLDPERSGLYTRYRLLVAYLLEREDWTIDELLTSPPDQEAVERRLLDDTKR